KLQATWELFSGFATRADTAAAAHEYSAALNNRGFVDRKVVEDLRVAWQQLKTARERVVLLQNAVNIASEVHDARRKLREAGKETVLNVLDAENEVFSAQINATGAEYDARSRRACHSLSPLFLSSATMHAPSCPPM
ncbi:MAG: TolC family protein, partial [Planctomycetes bacterium]|nr:TolC family protein [Planctomycetota bacterium]